MRLNLTHGYAIHTTNLACGPQPSYLIPPIVEQVAKGILEWNLGGPPGLLPNFGAIATEKWNV